MFDDPYLPQKGTLQCSTCNMLHRFKCIYIVFTYSHVLLVLSIGESHVAQFKVSLSVLEGIGDSRAGGSLPKPTFTENQVVNVTTVFDTFLSCNWVEAGRRRRDGEMEREKRERERERERERGM